MVPVTFDELNQRLRDGAYIGIGLGVLAFQRAQVQRQELRKQVRGVVHEATQVAEDAVARIAELGQR